MANVTLTEFFLAVRRCWFLFSVEKSFRRVQLLWVAANGLILFVSWDCVLFEGGNSKCGSGWHDWSRFMMKKCGRCRWKWRKVRCFGCQWYEKRPMILLGRKWTDEDVFRVVGSEGLLMGEYQNCRVSRSYFITRKNLKFWDWKNLRRVALLTRELLSWLRNLQNGK